MRLIHRPEVQAGFPGHYTGALRLAIVPDRLPRSGITLASDNHTLGDFVPSVIEPRIEGWRSAFKRMGAKSGERCSLEALYRFWQKRGALYHVNAFVNLYNAYCLTRGVPMGAYDAARLMPEFALGRPPAGLAFTPLGKPGESETPRPEEIVYFDSQRILCRLWNMKDCDQTKITDATSDTVLMFDMLAENADGAMRQFAACRQDWERFAGIEIRAGGAAGPGLGEAIEL
jgi:DNA/RNA-binding domain of Phe-tRNA-synthetase-like protein